MDVTGFPETGPTKVGVAITDCIAALYAVQGILLAHISRCANRTGASFSTSRCSILPFRCSGYRPASSRRPGASPGRLGNEHPSLAPYGPYPAARRPDHRGGGQSAVVVALLRGRSARARSSTIRVLRPTTLACRDRTLLNDAIRALFCERDRGRRSSSGSLPRAFRAAGCGRSKRCWTIRNSPRAQMLVDDRRRRGHRAHARQSDQALSDRRPRTLPHRLRSANIPASFAKASSPIERLPVQPARPVSRRRLAHFDRAEVRRAAGESVVDRGNGDAGVHGFAGRLQPEVQIHGVIHRVAFRRIGRRHALEDVEVDLDAVRFLAGGGAKLGERRKFFQCRASARRATGPAPAPATRTAPRRPYSGDSRCSRSCRRPSRWPTS